MRGRLTAGLMPAAMLLNVVLAGCVSPDLPPGADGRLTDDWPPVAQATGYLPSVGRCLDTRPAEAGGSTGPAVTCDRIHYAEVAHVGAFPGDEKPGPEHLAAAYTECDTKAAAYLGRPWWEGRLELRLTLPGEAAWEGGARWFRCDLIEVGIVDKDGHFITRAGSLKDGFWEGLVVGCAEAPAAQGRRIDWMREVPCATAHNAEYAGFLRAESGVPYPESDREWNALFRQCRDAVAPYIGISRAQAAGLGVIAWPATEENWAAGDHRVRCAVWTGTKTLKKSVKGSKGKGIPAW
ncbi:septum formation family protein [Catellatospora sichuanensis]|uniref:septum formation family protein n=1 Tax=Catellatospora sichuanensis TaxID=1969805 RepID=UPI0011835A60|nr:septum formation family protein [Catellatospora sichuanensis]